MLSRTRCLMLREPTQTKPGCVRRPRRHSGSAFSARRVSRRRMENCSGATTALSGPSLGQKTDADQNIDQLERGFLEAVKPLLSRQPPNVRFSNRPFGVKHFQTVHHHSVDVAHGLVLLFGIGTRALPSWDSKTRWNNLLDGLAVKVTVGPSGHTNSPHPSSREGHHSTARWSSSVLLLRLILRGFHAAAAACSRVHRNSVPSTQMRCMITASRRASATTAFFIPRRLAICIAQALSQDHFVEWNNMLWAAS